MREGQAVQTFRMVLPLRVSSTAAIPIEDTDGMQVGTIRRFYPHKFQRWIDLVMDGLFIHVCAMDEIDCPRVKMVHQQHSFRSWLRQEWKLEFLPDSGTMQTTAVSKTKIRTHPRLRYANSHTEVEVRRDLGDRTTRFLEHASNQLLAEVHTAGLSPNKYRHVEIHIRSEMVNELEVACIYYAFRLGT